MADKEVRVRCSVCGDGVPVKGNCVTEHNHKYTGAKIVCYGSFLPVFMDNKGQYQTGNVMYISRHRQPWEELDDDE